MQNPLTSFGAQRGWAKTVAVRPARPPRMSIRAKNFNFQEETNKIRKQLKETGVTEGQADVLLANFCTSFMVSEQLEKLGKQQSEGMEKIEKLLEKVVNKVEQLDNKVVGLSFGLEALEKSVKKDMEALEKSGKKDMEALEKSVKKDVEALEKSVKKDVEALEKSQKEDMEALAKEVDCKLLVLLYKIAAVSVVSAAVAATGNQWLPVFMKAMGIK